MKRRVAYVFLVMIIFSSCTSNSIYYDMEQQAVVRCEGVISNLYITSKDNEDYFHFSVLPTKEGSRVFNMQELNKDYLIEVRGKTDVNQYRLRPETEYEIINHSNGDASDGKLVIRTDQNGIVIYADKTSCK